MGHDMKSVNKTIKKVRDMISRYDMITPGDRVVVAVSGGPDSICLLSILHELKDDLRLALVVAHFDHGLRPAEDEHETGFVESMAVSLELPFETKRADQCLRQGSASFEEMARQARYQYLEGVKEKFFAQKIAVGHNLNDQAETVLMRLLRGSGPTGLAGIPPYREEKIIRPLIEISRKEIESYLDEKGLKYVTDSSNFEPRYLRNRIRMELIPLLKRYQPNIVELLGKTAEIMRSDEAWLEAEARQWVKKKSETGERGEIQIPLIVFLKLPSALRSRVIRHLLRIGGGSLHRVSSRHIQAINNLAEGEKSQARVVLPNRLIVKKTYDRLIFSVANERKSEGYCYVLNGPGTFHLEVLGSTISLQEMKKRSVSSKEISPKTALLNADNLTYPLRIRNSRPGDKFVPLGMKGHKKLKDFFIDLKISSEDRQKIPILTCQDMPIWVCGLRIDDRFKVTPDTLNILKVTLTGHWNPVAGVRPLA
jgi:tRNA(Ile)-lysidine synthase